MLAFCYGFVLCLRKSQTANSFDSSRIEIVGYDANISVLAKIITVNPVLKGPFIKRNFVLNGNAVFSGPVIIIVYLCKVR
jgi:hypothetical protein